MGHQYQTIAAPSEGTYKEKGSKFIAFALPVSDLAAVKLELESLKKQYYDARHHCYAYVLGAAGEEYRANDDGEPHHSAGDPILGQIRAYGLTNVLVVVVRYFGGTKLGVGGLIQAYKTAATEALSQARVVSKVLTKRFILSFPYDSTQEVMRLVHKLGVQIIAQGYTEECSLELGIPVGETDYFSKQVDLLRKKGVDVTFSTV